MRLFFLLLLFNILCTAQNDSVFYALKARSNLPFDKVDKLKPHQIYTVYVDSSCVYMSGETDVISLFKDAHFTMVRKWAIEGDHYPIAWMTSESIIQQIDGMRGKQQYMIKIQSLPSTYTHINKRGVKCGHQYSAIMCKIISVKAL